MIHRSLEKAALKGSARGRKVGFADAVGSEADVFRFVASASAFDDFNDTR